MTINKYKISTTIQRIAKYVSNGWVYDGPNPKNLDLNVVKMVNRSKSVPTSNSIDPMYMMREFTDIDKEIYRAILLNNYPDYINSYNYNFLSMYRAELGASYKFYYQDNKNGGLLLSSISRQLGLDLFSLFSFSLRSTTFVDILRRGYKIHIPMMNYVPDFHGRPIYHGSVQVGYAPGARLCMAMVDISKKFIKGEEIIEEVYTTYYNNYIKNSCLVSKTIPSKMAHMGAKKVF